jgi:hypothetical protein
MLFGKPVVIVRKVLDTYTPWANCTAQETRYVSVTKPSRLMLFGETVAVYWENHTEHTDTLCGKNAEL